MLVLISLFHVLKLKIVQFSKEQESNEGTPHEDISATINDDDDDESVLLNDNDESALLDDDDESELLDDEHDDDDESELLDDEHEEKSCLVPTTTTMKEERPNSEPVEVHGNNALQNDIQWGHETVKKFLTKLGLL